MLVHRVSCKSRYFQPEHDTSTSEADLRNQTLKAFAIRRPSPRLAQVRIDDNDLLRLPAQSDGMLPLCALDIAFSGAKRKE